MARIKLNYIELYRLAGHMNLPGNWVSAAQDLEEKQGYIEAEDCNIWWSTTIDGVDIKIYRGWILEWLK
jgi:hypothetical protein